MAGNGEGETRMAEALGRLLDAVIEEAPNLLRQRALLPAVDWKKATVPQVARLCGVLADARIELPVWLARDLLIGGHSLPASVVEKLAPELRALAGLHGLPAGAKIPDGISHALSDLAAGAAIDSAIAAAIMARLVKLDAAGLAARFALAHYLHTPSLLRTARKEIAAFVADLKPARVRVASFTTSNLLAEALKPALAAAGRRAQITEADYGAVIAELMSPDCDADALLLLLDFDGLFSQDWRAGLPAIASQAAAKIDALAGAIAAFAARHAVPLLVNRLPATASPAVGHIDRTHAAGAAAVTDALNRRLSEIAATSASVHLIDADTALSEIAPDQRSDPKLWYYGRIAWSDAATRALAHAFARTLAARARGPAKVLALDFDNTLWGGVYGDDGVDKLVCGDEFPGNAFRAFQQECLRLKAQGMVVVGLSKNNADAIEAFARHPGMALKADDFAATAINWEPKPDNIRHLANELNLGLDSFVFLDDSPHEREAMRRMCPMVNVPEMPVDPALRPRWLRALTSTWPLRLTDEDARRSDMYAAERKAKELRETSVSYDDYLKELDQKLVVEAVGPETLPRVAQLHQRTNQFNLTTQRFGEAEIAALASDPNAVVLAGTVSDRFGDHGLTAAAVATIDGDTARIASFLMSCRVMGRQIETAFLAALAQRLATKGIARIEAVYKPTPKNGMVRDFYARHGFAAAGQSGEDTSWSWRKEEQASLSGSPFVTVEWRAK